MSWGQMITKSYVFGVWIFIDREEPSILAGVSLSNALVVGNGSYILRAYGHDLHGPTGCLPVLHATHRFRTKSVQNLVEWYSSQVSRVTLEAGRAI